MYVCIYIYIYIYAYAYLYILNAIITKKLHHNKYYK